MARFATPYELNEIYDTLVDRDIPTPTELQSNFGLAVPFETETINLDKISPDLRIGIFVAPDVSAKATVQRGYQTKVFNPGYWKDKATVDFRNLRVRKVGEQIATPTSNAGKIATSLQDSMVIMKAKRERLLEWISSQILLWGAYTATSELHPAVLVDLEPNIATHLTTDGTSTATVPAAQAVGLGNGKANRANISGTNITNPTTGQVIPTLGTARNWGGASATPVADLQSMLNAAWEPISKIYISDDAFAELQKDALFSKIVTPYLQAPDVFLLQAVPIQQSKEGLKLRGFMGNIPIWTYSAEYQATTAATTALTKFISSGYVVMVPDSRYGVQAFGAIQHGGADFQAIDIFWNSWTEEETGKPWLQGQSAPIFLHLKVNSTVCWKVM
jgi:hypothetical protein